MEKLRTMTLGSVLLLVTAASTAPPPRRWTRVAWWGWRSDPAVPLRAPRAVALEQPLPTDATVTYAAKFHIDDHVFLLELRRESDSRLAAREFSDGIGAEFIKRRWIDTVLRRGHARGQRPLAWSRSVAIEYPQTGTSTARAIDVHVGDDLGQVATWYGYRYGLDDGAISSLHDWLLLQTPQHASAAWIEARAEERPSALSAVASLDVAGEAPPCSVTVAITTCRRLALFRQTATSLLRALKGEPRVCRFIVVDDGSPLEDRAAMLHEFPAFEFIFKPASRRGHADSMNIIATLITTRYVLYIEDDWLSLGFGSEAEAEVEAGASGRPTSATRSSVVADALAVLRSGRSGRPLAQVLLNDQSSRSCAQGFAEACGTGVLGAGGWRRGGVDGGSGGGGGGSVPEYREHEFGLVLRPPHGFSYWPGFSLNPGVWDLARLRAVGVFPAETERAGAPFNVSDGRFEQSFSMRVADSGLRVAFLPRLTMRHLGVPAAGGSAYVISGTPRPWDLPQE